MLRLRLLTALIGIPLGLVIIYLGGWVLLAVVAILALLGMHEFFSLTRITDTFTRIYGATGVLVILLLSYLLSANIYPYVGFGLVMLIALDAIGRELARARREAIHTLLLQIAAVTVGLFYIPFLFGYLVQLRNLEALRPLPSWLLEGHEGAPWLFLVLSTCWVIDTAAYFVGKAFGRHKLAPKISPGKTIEGGLAGLAAAVGWTLGVGLLLGLTTLHALILGTLLGVGGQIGDLFESLLKRRAGVKDAGTLLPGHGGVLDRFDSLLFCAPIAFHYLYMVMR